MGEVSVAVSMTELTDVVDQLLPWLYAGLAILSLVEWLRRRGRAAAWLCGAFVVLASVVLLGVWFDDGADLPRWLERLPVALIPLFPYALSGFMGSFIRPPGWLRVVAPVLTAGLSLSALALPVEREGGVFLRWWVPGLLLHWVLLSGYVVAQLWRAGRDQPVIARRRMRTMSLGAAGLAVAIVIAGEVKGNLAGAVVQLLALGAAPLLLAGFAPPYLLRQWWRRHEAENLKEVELSLVKAADRSAVTEILLESARTLVGGTGAVLERSDGSEIGHVGDVSRRAEEGAFRSDEDLTPIVVSMRSHRLIVFVDAFTPFFGQEEVSRLHAFAAVADVALERNELSEEQSRLAAIVESSSSAISTKDLNGTITSWNRGAEDMYGYSAEEIVGRSVDLLIPPEASEDFDSILSRVIESGKIADFHTKRRTKDGRILDVSLNVSPVRDSSGDVVGASVIARDITEDVRLAAEAQEQAEMLNLAQDAIIARSPDGRVTYWNLAAEERYGWSKQEAVGRIVHELLHTVFDAPLDEIEAILNSTGRWEGVLEHTTRDGGVLIVASRWAVRREADGVVFEVLEVNNDITEQKEAEEALRLARLEADRANMFKTEFLSRMSHELRTPLNAVLGFAQLLELDDLRPDQRDSIEQIAKGGRRLLELINDVLDIARIESGTLRLSLEPVPVTRVIDDAIGLIRPLAESRGIRLSTAIDDVAELHANADQQRLGQAVLNLLSNAVKYNIDNGSIEVKAFALEEPSRVRIDVTDTGRGIPEDQMDLLFEPFERLGAEQTSVEGTGLGLSLSRSLVQAMGGTLEAETTTGKGTTFCIELQAADAVHQPEQTGDAARGETTDVISGRVLYIEDNLSNLRLVERLITKRPGVSLISAETGNMGLELAQQHRPDLIFLDLHLPDLEGEAVLARLQKDPRTSDIPVVILSADATSGQIRRLVDAGAMDYLTKPIEIPKFFSILQRALGDSFEETETGS